MLKEFKDFALRGNVMDLAVAVIIGAAFTGIVNSLVGDIITPILGILTGGIDFTGLMIKVGGAEIKYGNFIQATVNFLIIAFVIFLMVRAVNRLKDRFSEPEPAAGPAPTPEDIVLLREIRDSLKQR